MRRSVLVALPLLAALLLAGACGGDSSSPSTTAKPSPTTVRPQASASMSPTKVLDADLQYSTFAKVWAASGKSDDLDGLKELTVFAPANLAMDTLPAEERERLITDTAAAAAFVDRYTVAKKLSINDLINLSGPVTTVAGTQLAVTLPGTYSDPAGGSVSGSAVRVGGAPISTADIQTRNGYVQVINALLPSS